MEEDAFSSHPSASHTQESVSLVQYAICGDRTMTIPEAAAEGGISYGTCQMILSEGVGMRSLKKIHPNGHNKCCVSHSPQEKSRSSTTFHRKHPSRKQIYESETQEYNTILKEEDQRCFSR
jgi:hypothetical protein